MKQINLKRIASRKRKQLYSIGDKVGYKIIIAILPSLGYNHYYRVRCITCNAISIAHQEGLYEKRSVAHCKKCNQGKRRFGTQDIISNS